MELGRNLESIRRQSGDWREEELLPRADEALARRTLFDWLPPGKLDTVAELGLGPEARPPAGAANYHGYDRRASARARLEARAPHGAPATLPDGAELPLATKSLDLFLSLFTLERLRMDELYMAINEMRRLVKPGAYVALASIHPGENWWERLVAKWHARRGRGNPLQLPHYLSPEDWDTVKEGKLNLSGSRVAGLLLLRRRDDDAV